MAVPKSLYCGHGSWYPVHHSTHTSINRLLIAVLAGSLRLRSSSDRLHVISNLQKTLPPGDDADLGLGALRPLAQPGSKLLSEQRQQWFSTVKVFLTTREAAWYIISVVSVCPYACLSVCQMITFGSLDIECSFSHIRYISRGYRSSSYMKVIGSRSKSQEPNRSKMPIGGLPAM